MESKLRVISPDGVEDQWLKLLDEAETVPLLISGNSMVPFMVHGRDTVFLSKIKEPLKKGDMIFYRRATGMYVLHRICKAEKESYSLVGDAQWEIEKGIHPNQVIAKVVAVSRKGKLLKKGNFLWFFFEKIWLRMIPLRPLCIRLYTFCRRVKRRK